VKIIFNDNEGLKILTPAIEIDPVILGEKDVPSGLKFKVIDDSDLPSDRTYRSAWTYEITDTNKDGVGLTKEQFYSKYPHLTGWAVQ
jgi:hypothetical protein